jgi:hypothetical protein
MRSRNTAAGPLWVMGGSPAKLRRRSMQLGPGPALIPAVSPRAGLLITTEAMVAEVPKKQSPAMPGGPGGGMGGMDF